MSFTTGLRTILESLGDGVERYLNFLLLVTIDMLEVSILVGLLFVLGRVLLRIPSRLLIFASVCLCLLIMAANQYSLLLVANVATTETVAIASTWAFEHPQIIWHSLGPSQVAFLLIVVFWPLFFATLPARSHRVHLFLLGLTGRWHSCLLLTVLIGSLLGGITFARMSESYPVILRGYWSSTVISFFNLDTPELSLSDLPPQVQIRADYERLAFPRGLNQEPALLVAPPVDKLAPRHIVIVLLETAPQHYYPLSSSSELPVFAKMSQNALVSDRHYAMSPYSWWNIASILSGTYFLEKGRGIFDIGEFVADSLPTLLGQRGYSTTFVVPSKIGWAGTTGFWENLGYRQLIDSASDPIPYDSSTYALSVEKERQAFTRALGAIDAAQSRKQNALVTIATAIGHFPWPTRPGEEDRSNEEKLLATAAIFDGLMGEFLQGLEKRGLGDQVIIVVTGDHGFRMSTEFESVGLVAEHGNAAFNVPFLLYAPGIFEDEIRLPYVTSHVDIAPTLLALTGQADGSWLHHGRNMLDQSLRKRATFMMNTNLSPVSGFLWAGCHYTFHDLTGKIHRRARSSGVAPASPENSGCERGSAVLSDEAVKSMLEGATRQFQIALGHFRWRKAATAD